MTNEGTILELLIEGWENHIRSIGVNNEYVKGVSHAIELAKLCLDKEKSQLEQAYEEGTKYESERLDFEDYYKSIKLNK